MTGLLDVVCVCVSGYVMFSFYSIVLIPEHNKKRGSDDVYV